MSDRTDALVRELVSGLRPVRRLQPLGALAAGIVGISALIVAIELIAGRAPQTPFLKPNYDSLDTQTILVHAWLAASALAFALGEFVPGRERLRRAGGLGLAFAFLALLIVVGERLAAWPGLDSLPAGWAAQTFACTLGAIVPAAIPALLLAVFAARAAPHRAARSLAVASAAAVALLTLPGIVHCAYPDQLHHIVGHLLAPVSGAVLLLVVALPAFFIARARQPV